MNKKIVIVGAGHVGTHVASMLLSTDICRELVLIDKNYEKANGHAWDLLDTMAYQGHSCKVYAGDYDDISDADLLFFSACGGYFNENRLEELDETMEIVDEVAPCINASEFHGIVISITNPCDLIAYYLQTKINSTVIGSGTMLDSARFRTYIANALGINVKDIVAYSVGEHGDSQVPLWSQVRIGTKDIYSALKSLGKEKDFPFKEITKKTIFAGGGIAGKKGCTEFGIGQAACELAKTILQDERRILPCSTMLHGEYGESGLYASVPCLIGRQGVIQTWIPEISEEEREVFHNSCKLLKKYIADKMTAK